MIKCQCQFVPRCHVRREGWEDLPVNRPPQSLAESIAFVIVKQYQLNLIDGDGMSLRKLETPRGARPEGSWHETMFELAAYITQTCHVIHGLLHIFEQCS